MKKLWIAFVVLATLGSVYPFDFQLSALQDLSPGAFLNTCCTMSSRGDILGNVILFIPIGFTGMLASRSDDLLTRRIISACLVGAVIALALQLMQVFLPSRDENLQDVLWNLVGTAVGALAAGIAGSLFPDSEKGQLDVTLVPLTLVGTWLAYRLIPFVPSFDLQMIKNSVRPMLHGPVDAVNVIHDISAWVVVAYLLRKMQRGLRLDMYLPVLIIGVFCLEILIVNNSITRSNVLGAVLAVFLWWGVVAHIRWQEAAVAALLVVALVLDGLAPFEVRETATAISWLPFDGFLNGSMYINAQSAAEKVFLYGSLVYLMWRTRVNIIVSVLIGFSIVMMIELSQTIFVGHTPEITDPLLVVFAALALLALERNEALATVAAGPGVDHVGKRLSKLESPTPISDRRNGNWVDQKTNLRASQFEFLEKLSQEMGISVSRVVRRIVAEFIDGLDKNASPKSAAITADPAACQASEETTGPAGIAVREAWVVQSVNLRKDQYDFLLNLAAEMDCSVSRIVRRIISRFVAVSD